MKFKHLIPLWLFVLLCIFTDCYGLQIGFNLKSIVLVIFQTIIISVWWYVVSYKEPDPTYKTDPHV